MYDNDKKLQGKHASSAGKEEEPVIDGAGLKEAPNEHRELAKEKEIGEYVSEIPVRTEIPIEVERAGVKHTVLTSPIGKKQKKKIKLPLTDDQIAKGLHAHIWQSLHWLAAWCIRKLKKAHIVVKEVHGKLVKS